MKPKHTLRFLSVLLALLLIAAPAGFFGQFVPGMLTASAAQTDSGFQYILDTDKKTAQITGYTGSAVSMTIPSMIEGCSVTTLASEAFKGRNTLLSVVIPDTVTMIGSECFSGCTLLGTVELGKNVTSIGSKAFENCAVLASIAIPKTTTLIGDLAFSGCRALSSIKVDSSNGSYSSKDGVLFDRLATTLIAYPAGRSGENYTVPDVATIESYAFCGAKNLKSVAMSVSTLTVKKGAFKDCTSLVQVVLPSKLTKIEDELFSGCKKLSALSFPNTISCIGADAFKNCIAIPALVFPENVTTVGAGAFAGCTGIASVTIGKGLTAITGAVFSGCTGIKEFKVSEGASFSVSDGVLFNKEGTRLIAFPAGSSITTYTVGDQVTAIGANAFDSCNNLETLVIPAAVVNFDEPVVVNCSRLTIQVEDNSEAKTYFQIHTTGFDTLKIGAEKRGDINGDGKIDSADVMLLSRYVSKWKNVTIHTEAADVYMDSEIDSADVVILRRYVAGWKNVTLMFEALPYSASEEGDASVHVSNASGKAGDTVVVTVDLRRNPGVISLELNVGYDTKQLELIDVRDSGILNGFASPAAYNDGNYKLCWENGLATTNNNGTGTLAVLTFRLKEDCDKANVTVSGKGYDTDLNRVGVSGSSGTITNTSPTTPIQPSVAIRNFTESKTVGYRATVTFAADVTNGVSGGEVHWFIDGQDKGTGETYTTYTVEEAKKSYTVQAKYVKNGEVLAESRTEKVNVKTGFFARLKAFILALFGLLPREAQAYLGAEYLGRLLP